MSVSEPGLRLRKIADTSAGQRVKRYDPETGASYLADPETWDINDRSTWEANSWPLVGVQLEGNAPKKCSLSTGFVQAAVREGWATVEGASMVHRPGGPEDDPWRVTHSFPQADAIVLHLVDGDVRYRVVEQPDKWPDVKNDLDEGFGGDVRWFYKLKLEA